MKPLTHSQAKHWLQAAADGLLAAESQAQLAAHLQQCPECQAYADELHVLEAALSSSLQAHWGQPDLPAGSSRQLLERLTGRPAPRPFNLRWLILLAALAGAALLAWLWFSRPPAAAPASETVSSATTVGVATTDSSPSATPVASATLGSSHTPATVVVYAVPQQTANCRLGASSQFDIADTLHEGERYQPLGRGRDNLWLQFRGPVTGVRCWAFTGNLTVLLNEDAVPLTEVPESLLPYLAYPPTPTPVPSATAVPTQCSDGLDNDGDGYIDMQDRECSDPSDNNEAN